jgi:hypothetical protein
MIGLRPADGSSIFRPIWFMLIGLALAATSSAGRAADPPCEVPAGLLSVDEKLTHLAQRLKAGGPIKIVAIGGASTAGLAAGSTDLSYPQRMRQVLARRYPGTTITLVNKSQPRQTAQEMLARFAHDVLTEKPVLVIWETGTVDAVRGVDVDAFAATLLAGADLLAAHGIDLILVDMQFSHKTQAVIDLGRYLEAIHRVGDVREVYVFPRFAIMRYWSEQEVFDLDGTKSGRAALAADVYQCLGRKLADAIRVALQ